MQTSDIYLGHIDLFLGFWDFALLIPSVDTPVCNATNTSPTFASVVFLMVAIQTRARWNLKHQFYVFMTYDFSFLSLCACRVAVEKYASHLKGVLLNVVLPLKDYNIFD